MGSESALELVIGLALVGATVGWFVRRKRSRVASIAEGPGATSPSRTPSSARPLRPVGDPSPWLRADADPGSVKYAAWALGLTDTSSPKFRGPLACRTSLSGSRLPAWTEASSIVTCDAHRVVLVGASQGSGRYLSSVHHSDEEEICCLRIRHADLEEVYLASAREIHLTFKNGRSARLLVDANRSDVRALALQLEERRSTKDNARRRKAGLESLPPFLVGSAPGPQRRREAKRRKGPGKPPSPSLIQTPADAERVAASWMRWMGFGDAEATQLTGDRGLDVIATGAVAQVKAQVVPVGRPDLQSLAGAATGLKARLLFFALSGYTREAADWGDEVGMALFTFDFQGRPEPVNGPARRLFPRSEPQRK